ncbi:hypothetical protein HELRODRAFT_183415 [Helobdella robusta]|uniref:Uncharacterized protein n=1 Tax=Helobdella robusta TaxID=6412 RepID=T1FJL7_HELRO|nr:hypothetical protein HELRODRAFT_183415 [Helobdella robusta]ESO11175.1 hypothetical protein HELRODRAFT_183415 [Helobdella robusta]
MILFFIIFSQTSCTDNFDKETQSKRHFEKFSGVLPMIMKPGSSLFPTYVIILLALAMASNKLSVVDAFRCHFCAGGVANCNQISLIDVRDSGKICQSENSCSITLNVNGHQAKVPI